VKEGKKMTDSQVIFEQLRELAAWNGVSGKEHAVVKYLKDFLTEFADEVFIDPFGNISALRTGKKPGPRFMISAHSDEVGVVITAVTKDGFLLFTPVGVVDPAIFPGTRLQIGEGIIGTVVVVPGHVSTGANGQPNLAKKLLLDVGAESDSQAYEWGIQPGSVGTFISPLIHLNWENLVMGKAVDNRVGCLILLQLFEQLKGKELPGDLYGVITVQEETGMQGAQMITHRINPDFAIVLDTVPLDDTPLNSMPDVPLHLGGGPVFQLRTGKEAAFLGTVANQNLTNLLQETARDLNIKTQTTATYGKWVTDGAVIHTSQNGIPTAFLSVPRRYGHTPNEVADLNDIAGAIEIIKTFVEKKPDQFCSDFF